MTFAVEILSEGKVCHSLFVEVPHDLLRYLGRPKAASEVMRCYPFHPVSDQGKEWRCDIFPNSFTFFQEQLCDLGKMYHSSWWAFVCQEKMSSFFPIMSLLLLRVWLFQGTSSPVGSSWPLWWQIPIVPRRRGQLQCRWRLQVPTKAWLGDA